MPAEMRLAQQPPSLLALAGPPPHVSTFRSDSHGFHGEQGRLRPRTTPGISLRAAGRTGNLRSTGRRFGALSAASQTMSSACSSSSEALAARAIKTARVPSLAFTAAGAALSHSKSPYAANREHVDVSGGGEDVRPRGPLEGAHSAVPPNIGQRSVHRHAASDHDTSQGGSPDESLLRTALRVSDLERMGCATKVSTLPARRAAAEAEALALERRALDETRLSSPLPHGSLPVRALLAPDRILDDPRGSADQCAYLSAGKATAARPRMLVARTRAGEVSASPTSASPSSYVPLPAPGGGLDPWKASEEDLKRQAFGRGMAEDVAAVRRAAAVGYIRSDLAGFC